MWAASCVYEFGQRGADSLPGPILGHGSELRTRPSTNNSLTLLLAGNKQGSLSGSLARFDRATDLVTTPGLIIPASEGRTDAVQGHVVKIGRDLVAGTPVAQVILGFPGRIHDQVVRPGNDL